MAISRPASAAIAPHGQHVIAGREGHFTRSPHVGSACAHPEDAPCDSHEDLCVPKAGGLRSTPGHHQHLLNVGARERADHEAQQRGPGQQLSREQHVASGHREQLAPIGLGADRSGNTGPGSTVGVEISGQAVRRTRAHHGQRPYRDQPVRALAHRIDVRPGLWTEPATRGLGARRAEIRAGHLIHEWFGEIGVGQLLHQESRSDHRRRPERAEWLERELIVLLHPRAAVGLNRDHPRGVGRGIGRGAVQSAGLGRLAQADQRFGDHLHPAIGPHTRGEKARVCARLGEESRDLERARPRPNQGDVDGVLHEVRVPQRGARGPWHSSIVHLGEVRGDSRHAA